MNIDKHKKARLTLINYVIDQCPCWIKHWSRNVIYGRKRTVNHTPQVICKTTVFPTVSSSISEIFSITVAVKGCSLAYFKQTNKNTFNKSSLKLKKQRVWMTWSQLAVSVPPGRIVPHFILSKRLKYECPWILSFNFSDSRFNIRYSCTYFCTFSILLDILTYFQFRS